MFTQNRKEVLKLAGKTKDTVKETINETILATIDAVQRYGYYNAVKPADHKAAIEETEKMLYYYQNLCSYLELEKQFIITAMNGDEKKAEYLIKNPISIIEDVITSERIYRYIRTKKETCRLEKALAEIRLEKGYYVIEARYFSNDYYGETPTWQIIAEDLAGQYGFSEKLNEKTCRTQNKKMLEKIAFSLYGM